MKRFSQYISEGGQFGHLSNIWEVGNLTTNKLVDIISKSLDLDFGIVDVKLDSVALSFTVRKDGTVVGARNKSHSKNFGENGLDFKQMADKFKGRELEFAYSWALRNLQSAVDSLSDKQKTKIFNDGRNWMAVEVIGYGAKNIIDYAGVEELVLLGTIEHDQDGNKIGPVNKDHARILDGMLRQRSAEKQSKFEIKTVTPATFNQIKDSDKIKRLLISQLKKVMRGYKTVDDFRSGEVRKIIQKHTKDKELVDVLVQRWAMDNKSFNIKQVYKQWPNDQKWISTLEKNIGNTIKLIMLPLEKIFLRLGAEVLMALNVFKSKDPSKTARKLRKDFLNAVKKVQASNDQVLVQKMALELQRLEAAGGVGAISPEEGITFFVNNGSERVLVKLTGTFAPVNQIMGLLWRT